jgi:hypothetical protein
MKVFEKTNKECCLRDLTSEEARALYLVTVLKFFSVHLILSFLHCPPQHGQDMPIQ